MPSILGNVMRAQIKLMKPILKRIDMDIEQGRAAQDSLGELGAKALRAKVEYLPEEFDGFEAQWAVPRSGDRGGAILYLHGGSYTAGTLSYARGFGGILADACGRRTLCVGYRLAPENPFPAALDDAYEAYRRVLERCPPGRVAVVGESAGGGLVYALLLRIKREGSPMPACAVALSPWCDLTCSGQSYSDNEEVDPSLFRPALMKSAGYYGGDDLKNPLISPLFGDLSGLPDSLIFVGGDELLRSDAISMRDALTAHGCRCECRVEEGMWHVYVLFGIPEAKEALERINDFLGEKIGDENTAEEAADGQATR